ncbi:hypothetical protein K3495_g9945 [Podosphaera aphanis]|nr:hypothetical protein K3495_g9945 [Podosphaera aphanis]
MGGSAFSQHIPPILTPRMPRSVYSLVLRQTLSLLGTYYKYAASPVEAPGKDTFGDLDIIISQPLSPAFDDTKTNREGVGENLKAVLNAKAHLVRKGEPLIIFAVPWPREHAEEPSALEEKFVQIDVETCPSHHGFIYARFYKSHGDLWNILSSIIHPYGLRVNNKGLYLCITCIEPHHKKKSRIFLTSDPVEILEFLGLDVERYWKKFDSLEEIFRYAATCRMFILKKAPAGNASAENVLASNIFDTPECATLTKKDRARCAKRPMYAAWVYDFIPRCQAKNLYLARSKTLSAHQVRHDAFRRFGVKKKYEDTEREWHRARNLDDVWTQGIKPVVPVGVGTILRAHSLRALRGMMTAGNPAPDLPDLDLLAKDDDGLYNIAKVKIWVRKHWNIVGQRELARQRARLGETARGNWGSLAIRTKPEDVNESTLYAAETKE